MAAGDAMDKITLKTKTRLLLGAMALGVCAGGLTDAQAALAAEAQEGAFRVLSATVHADKRQAEACLSFSAPLAGDRASVLPQIQLKKEGKKLNIAAKDLDLSGSDLCLGDLDHGASYTLRVGRLVAEDGRKMMRPYETSFDMPHRKAALSFVGRSDLSSFPRHLRAAREDLQKAARTHILRSVNVGKVRMTLYRLQDKDTYAGAWQQFVQNAWTPSEGLYYARGKGKSVFESDLVFGDKPDEDQTLTAPLPVENTLTPGLYFLSAAPQGKDEQNPGLSAGQWFVVSNLRAGALVTPHGVQIATSDIVTRKAAAGVQVQVLTRDGKVLAKGQSDAEGQAVLSLDEKELPLAELVIATTAQGDMDLVDLKRLPLPALAATPVRATVLTDQDRYASGATMVASLRVTDARGQMRREAKGTLRLLRPDRKLYSQQDMVAKDGIAQTEMVLPIAQESGEWTLEWSEGDGTTLAASTFRIDAWGASGKVDIEAPAQAGERQVAVRVRATGSDGKPMAFAGGKLLVRAVRARSEAWKDYRFGLPVEASEAAVQEVPFITDAGGSVRVTLDNTGRSADVLALDVTPVLEGGAKGETKIVRLGGRGALIGIRPAQGERIAPGVTVARLDVLALDAEGRKRSLPHLVYTLIEEGRSFEWFPADGYWDYKPLPQRRRVAGGAVAFGAEGEAQINAPLTPGQYAIEIADGDGAALARTVFVVGPDGNLVGAAPEAGLLKVQTAPDRIEAGKAANVALRLDQPAVVSLVVADSRIRQSVTRALPAGTHSFALHPTEDWHDSVTLRAVALGAGEPAMIEKKIDVRDPRKEIDIAATMPAGTVLAGSELILPLRATAGQKGGEMHYAIVATPVPQGEPQALAPVQIKGQLFDSAGKANARLSVPVFDGQLRVEVTAWNDKSFGRRVWMVPVRPALSVDGAPPARMMQGDVTDVYLTLMNTNGGDAAYDYEWIVPQGVELKGAAKGRLTLGRNASQTLSLALEAKAPVLDRIELVAKGANGNVRHFVWPLQVRAAAAAMPDLIAVPLAADAAMDLSAALPAGAKEGLAVLGPVGLPDNLPPLLQTLLSRTPLTTVEIARWLEAANLWQQVLVDAGAVGAARFDELKAMRVQQLMRRQNEDGGFAATRTGRQSDLESTAAAFAALSGRAEAPATRAAAWLTQKLQNTWFDEAERDARALAFEALDAQGKADPAAIRYFAETSQDKTLSAAASSALALVFARSTDGQDKDKAKDWLARYRAARDTPSWEAARYTALNVQISAEEWRQLHPADGASARDTSIEQAAIILSAYAHAAQQSGTWRIEWKGQKVKHYGLFAVSVKAGQGVQTVRNEAGRPLTLSLYARTGKKDDDKDVKLRAGPALALRFYAKDGSRLDPATQSLAFGETYLLVAETEGRGAKDSSLRLSLPISGAFDARTPLIGAEAQVSNYVTGLPFTLAPALSLSTAVDAVRWDFDASKVWRGVVFLRAMHRGTFQWPALLIETEEGERLSSAIDPVKVTIK